MSWDSYIDNLITQSKDASGVAQADKACIIAIDGGEKWTTDGHPSAFKLTPEESANIARCFKSQDFSPFLTSGLLLEGQKYQFLSSEEGKLVTGEKKEVIMGKKAELGYVTLQASNTAVVIAFTAANHQQELTNKAVAVIAAYLEGLNM